MHKLTTDLIELCDAYSMNNEGIDHYLHVETGEIIVRFDSSLTGESNGELDEELEDEKYLLVPNIDSDTAYDLMDEFTATVESVSLRNELKSTLGGRKPFRAFKDVLSEHLDERSEWFEFESKAHRRKILQWLEGNHIQLIKKA